MASRTATTGTTLGADGTHMTYDDVSRGIRVGCWMAMVTVRSAIDLVRARGAPPRDGPVRRSPQW